MRGALLEGLRGYFAKAPQAPDSKVGENTQKGLTGRSRRPGQLVSGRKERHVSHNSFPKGRILCKAVQKALEPFSLDTPLLKLL